MKPKVIWLGQAGLLFEYQQTKILVDPYLSDSIGKMKPEKHRKVPVDERFLRMQPDVIVLTHNHIDHTDPETLEMYLKSDKKILVLASANAWAEVRKFGGVHNYVSFNQGTVWTENDIVFTAVYAEHSDSSAIGVIIDFDGYRVYITGDTLYNKNIFSDLTEGIDTVFLPINGAGNNMNNTDALLFSKECGAKNAVPLHFGLFDDIQPDGFEIVPEIYQEIKNI